MLRVAAWALAICAHVSVAGPYINSEIQAGRFAAYAFDSIAGITSATGSTEFSGGTIAEKLGVGVGTLYRVAQVRSKTQERDFGTQ